MKFVVSLTKIETDDMIIHESHKIWSNMFKVVNFSIQSSNVFDAKDKKAAMELAENREDEMIIPIMLAAAILKTRLILDEDESSEDE